MTSAIANGVFLALGALLLTTLSCQVLAERACDTSRFGESVRVASVQGLQKALDQACAGTEILISPGHYNGRIVVGPETVGTAEEPIVIRAEEGLGSVTIDGAGATITWKFDGGSFVRVQDLEITGGAYHGVFFSHGSNNILIENNRIYDNHRVQPMISHAEIKGSGGGSDPWPADIVLRGNEIFHSEHPPGSNFQGIDCNYCLRFHVVDNHFYDIGRPTANEYSYYDRGSCIQFKSNSEDIVIEGNLIERCNIGIVLGGEGLASPENISGIVRDNIVVDAEDIGLAIVNAKDFQVYGNRIDGAEKSIMLAGDRDFPEGSNTGTIADNELSHELFGIEEFDVQLRGNLVLTSRAFPDQVLSPDR